MTSTEVCGRVFTEQARIRHNPFEHLKSSVNGTVACSVARLSP